MPCAVILTALPVEYLAVRSHLSDLQEEMHAQGTIYERGKFTANGQEWQVGIVETGAGNAGAALEAERAIVYFNPDILFFVGIAGGIKDVAIGDVVAATKVYGYESGKADEQFSTRPALGQSSHALVQRARAEARKEEWFQRLTSNLATQPRVFVAPIAAGEKVVASRESELFQFLKASYNDAVAVEMEGFGFLSAAFAYPEIKAIVIRGISDLVENKNDDSVEHEQVRQKKASQNASAFAFEILAKSHTEEAASDALNQDAKLSTQTLPKPTQLPHDWGDAPDVPVFFGRLEELTLLESWIIKDRCQLVAILGIGGVGKTGLSLKLGRGGIGKTDLSLKLARGIQDQFEYVIWRSLLNAPPIGEFLADLVKFLSNQKEVDLPDDLDSKISRLIFFLRKHRCLLIIDNFETVLQGGRASQYKEGYKGYGQLLKQVGEMLHQSCLLLTSREKPQEISRLVSKTKPIRLLELNGLNEVDGQKIFTEIGDFSGSKNEWKELVEFYNGNPLALELAANHIQEVFFGSISEFLKQGKPVFDDIRDLLDWHFERLSEDEKEIIYWVAISRETMSVSEIKEDILSIIKKDRVPSVLQLLQRRLPLEKSLLGFTLQPVIIEYVTERIIEQSIEEIKAQKINLLSSHALLKASTKDYVRNIQSNLILEPLINRLITDFIDPISLQNQLKRTIMSLQNDFSHQIGYAGGNILNILRCMKADLRGADFSRIPVWQAYLQGANLQGVNFSYSDLSRSTFTETLGIILSVAFSPNAKLLATGDANSEIRLWKASDGTLISIFQREHTSWIRAIAFDPSSSVLASGSDDQTVKLWDVSTGQCIKTLWGHTNRVRSITFSINNDILVSTGDDLTLRVWDINTGKCLKILHGHTEQINSLAFSSNDQLLASGSEDKTVKLWDINAGQCLRTLSGHTGWIRSVAFNSDSQILASGSDDQTIRLWDVNTGQCLRTLSGHTRQIRSVAFSPDSQILASGSDDQTIRLWDINAGQCLRTLQGHTGWIRSVAFSPDSQILASGSDDQTIRLWDINTSQCLKTLEGYTDWIWSVAFSPDGSLLSTTGNDQTIKLWDIKTAQCLKVLAGHSAWVWLITFSPDGKTLASCSGDHTIKLWDVNTEKCLKTLRDHKNQVRSVAFSPDGKLLASSSDDQTIRLWDPKEGQCFKILSGHTTQVWSVVFSPNSQLLASSSDDQTIRLWNCSTGECIRILKGHTNRIVCIAFDPNGQILASGSDDQTVKLWNVSTGQCVKSLEGHTNWIQAVVFNPNGQILASGSDDQTVKLWNVSTGQCVKSLEGHSNWVRSLSFSPDGQTIVSGSQDGTIRLWDSNSGELIKVLRSPRPYEGMNITGVKGLTQAQKYTLVTLGSFEVCG